MKEIQISVLTSSQSSQSSLRSEHTASRCVVWWHKGLRVEQWVSPLSPSHPQGLFLWVSWFLVLSQCASLFNEVLELQVCAREKSILKPLVMENHLICAAPSAGRAMLVGSETLWDKQSLPGAARLTPGLSGEWPQLVILVHIYS